MGRKQAIYAEASVPEYWVVDVQGEVIHQMWKPEGKVYAQKRQIAFGQPIGAAPLPA